MRRNVITAVLYTVVTTVLFGLIYPFVVTGLAQVLFHDKANGQLVYAGGQLVGSRLIGQSFTAPQYFHSRPSEAGNGYDAANSSGSNLGPTNKKLIDRVAGDVAALQVDHPGANVPIDLVTASGSGLDPHITPAAAEFQVGSRCAGATFERGCCATSGGTTYRGASAWVSRRAAGECVDAESGSRSGGSRAKIDGVPPPITRA
ncbi:K(+)-transporting ATPase subunit C [Tunturiibacter empetritectus]|uniref:K(+)-transporting ATPase subunit C n=1 Tax=Tunturiibacter empetritectus TaxID=3069691 RepID=UPI003D9B751A